MIPTERNAFDMATDKRTKNVLILEDIATKQAKQEQRRLIEAKRAKILTYTQKEDWDQALIALGVKNITLELIEKYSELFAGSAKKHEAFMAGLVKNAFCDRTKKHKDGTLEIVKAYSPSKGRKYFIETYIPAMKKREKGQKTKSTELWEKYGSKEDPKPAGQ